jgi:hypothetical protein
MIPRVNRKLLRKTLETLIRGRYEIRLQIRKITKNRKSEEIAKSTPTNFRTRSKTDRTLF